MAVLSEINMTVECRLISFLRCASKVTFIFYSSLKNESQLLMICEKKNKISQFINSRQQIFRTLQEMLEGAQILHGVERNQNNRDT